jgi:hypothetical protein
VISRVRPAGSRERSAVSAGWVAGSVRARALARRRLGAAAARRRAASGSLPEALRALADTYYDRGIRPGQTLAEAQQAIAGTILWDLRVLAGWLPRGGVSLLRTMAGWFEIANVDELMQAMAGRQAGQMFQLGALATAWPRLRTAGSPAALRTALAGSAWRDPGTDAASAIRLGMRARWAARVAGYGDPARTWAAGAAALLVAGERFAAGRQLPAAVADGTPGLLGQAAEAAMLGELAARLPAGIRWVLDGISSPDDLWRAEAAWWARVERDGFMLLRISGLDSGPVLGAVAVLAADAWRVRAALEIAARGGGPLEVYDAVA